LSGIRGISQNENTKWYFGTFAGLDFMTAPPTVLTNGAMSTTEGCASIADGAGNLLFYTDGSTVYNSSQVMMANGNALLGNGSAAQSCVIIKRPGNSTEYYIFTVQGLWGAAGLNYSIVDMALAGGQGSVTVKNTPLYAAACAEKITATRHCNGTDFWILIHEFSNTNNFRAYQLTSAGMNPTAVVSPIGNTIGPPSLFYLGCMKLSPNGRKLGMTTSLGDVDLFNFDNSTGVVSNWTPLGAFSSYGCEFSPDGTKFYSGGFAVNEIRQYDLCTGITTTLAATTPFSLQRASNGKIYVARASSTLGVINSPNVAGAGCNYTDNGQTIAPNTTLWSLPNFAGSSFNPQPPPSPPFTYTSSLLYGCFGAAFTAPATVQNFTFVTCAASGYSLSSFQWNFGDPGSGAANTSTLTNPLHSFMGPGSYTVQLILYYSCTGGTDTVKQVVNINTPCITMNSASITCASLGSATVTAVGGIGPFSYTWTPSGQIGPTATGLSPGSYTVTVFDVGSNFTYTAGTTFTSLIPLTATVANSPSITCNGAATGSAQVINIAGGSGNQNYLWTNGAVTSTLANPGNMTAGTWTYTISDALTGCMVNNTFTINQPPALLMNLSSNTPSACAGSSVALTGTVSGGTPKVPAPAYGYTWTGGPSASSYTPVQNIAGSYVYTLTAADFYNCIISSTIAINVIPNPTLAVLHASICPLQSATLTAAGASSYSWNGVPGPYTLSANPLVNTVYSVSGESLGCFASTTASITLKPVPAPTITSNNTLCQGNALIFSVSNGLAFNWTGPASFTSSSQSNTIGSIQLSQAGVYNVTLTAANGCTAAASGTVIVKPLPLVSIAPGNTSICVNTTSVALVSAGTAAQFTWFPASGLSSVNAATVGANPVVTTVYTLTGALNGCTATAMSTVNVVPPPGPFISLSSPSLCAQALNGSPASIILTGGGANTYTLNTPLHISNSNPAGPSSSLSLVPPFQPTGPATATLFGSNGVCTVSTTVVFTIVPNPTVSISSATPVICAGQSYTYTSSGANSYVWSTATPGQTLYTTGNVAVANPSISSIFSVMGGSLGCNSALQSSTITVNPLPSFSIGPEPARICIGSPVPLLIQGTGTSFTWSPALGLSAAIGASVLASPSASQNYNVSGSLNSCTSTAMITVLVMPVPAAVIATPAASICLNGSILMNGSGGLGYAWSGPQGIFTTGPELEVKAYSTAYSGVYTLTVTDQNGCRGSATQSITVLGLPAGSMDNKGLQGCVPFIAGFNFSMSPVSAPALDLNWIISGQTFAGNNFTYYVTQAGTYPVTGKVTDLNGCADTFTALIQGYAKPKADFYFSPDKPVEGLDPVMFTEASTGAVSVNWYFGNNHQHSKQRNPDFIFEQAGTYPIALVVSNVQGCSDTIIKPVVVMSDFALYVPNAFTPDGDGLNDLFGPVMRGVESYHFVIVDRWGETLFETRSFDASWDGFFKGLPCKEDVYVWMLEVHAKNTSHEASQKKITGSVLLYR
jgi:gliding motility-associated-like protein